jgi:hypothetical protein
MREDSKGRRERSDDSNRPPSIMIDTKAVFRSFPFGDREDRVL